MTSAGRAISARRRIATFLTAGAALGGCGAEPSSSPDGTAEPATTIEATGPTTSGTSTPATTGGSGAPPPSPPSQVAAGQLAVDGSEEDPALVAAVDELGGTIVAADPLLGIVRVEFEGADQAELVELSDELRRRGYDASLIATLDPGQLPADDG